jgi:hypothetical protein
MSWAMNCPKKGPAGGLDASDAGSSARLRSRTGRRRGREQTAALFGAERGKIREEALYIDGPIGASVGRRARAGDGDTSTWFTIKS